MAPAARTFEFDHLPSDDEAAVYFEPRNGGAGYRIVDRDGVLRIESRAFPARAICAVLALGVAAIVVFGDRFRNPLGDTDRAFIAFGGAMNVAIFYAIFSWLNRSAAATNPLVAFDTTRNEVRLAERAQPVALDDVVELIDWRMTFANAQDLGYYKKFFGNEENAPPHRHLMLLVKDGRRYRLEYLFHDPIDLYPRGQDPALVLAKALNRPVRTIRKSSTVRDLRPVDPFTKRFETSKGRAR